MPPLSAPKPNRYVDMRLAVLSSKSPAAHEVLAAVGDLARRATSSQHSSQVEEKLSSALRVLAAPEVMGALTELDVTKCEASLVRAAAEAFDAAFSDSTEERELFAEAAFAGLLVRDRVESVVFAARRFGTETACSLVLDAVQATEARFAIVDRTLTQTLARSFTGINTERRASLEALDADARERAVWFSACLDADGLLQSLAESPAGTAQPGVGPGVQRDLDASCLPAFVAKQKDGAWRFVDAESSALYRAALGTASASERAFLEHRARADADLAIALRESLDASALDEAAGDGSAE